MGKNTLWGKKPLGKGRLAKFTPEGRDRGGGKKGKKSPTERGWFDKKPFVF